jgi:hypothetical protein
MRVHALAQRGAGGDVINAQCPLKKCIPSKALNRIKVILCDAKQSKVALENIAIGNAAAHGKCAVDKGIEFGAGKVFANHGQSRVGTEVVFELFDNKVGHEVSHLLGESYMETN